ncbi:PAT family beta-lactamase induction signal transducer AmpG [Elusimicrobium simillimum]|uniref:MFS transporter n=1 Tax=Elusimicrobium simillimum TaxID=3143438 RepID=UPI003C6F36A6
MSQKNTAPWLFVPSLYFAEGLPYVVINIVSAVVYTKMGVSKDVMTFWTSFLYLPWVLKMFWSPLLESASTKRKWLLSAQFALAAIFVLIGFTFKLDQFFIFSMLGFFAGAFISATYDIATDGYYMMSLTDKDQSFYVGIRTLFYRLAMIFGGGILVMMAGFIERETGDISLSWTITMCALGVFFALAAVYHLFILPSEVNEKVEKTNVFDNFWAVFKSYFTQKNIVVIILFILLYRLGEASLEKMIAPFMLDSAAEGGLGLTTETFGFVRGTVSMAALIAGNIIGGVLLARYGFKKCIWAFVALLNVPNIFYVILSVYKPSLLVVGTLLTLEQFGYGLGFMAFTVFVMDISRYSKYSTSYYAISTGIMTLGMMIPNMVSGKLQMALGYTNFFIVTCVLTVPSFILVPFMLKTVYRENKAKTD